MDFNLIFRIFPARYNLVIKIYFTFSLKFTKRKTLQCSLTILTTVKHPIHIFIQRNLKVKCNINNSIIFIV